MIDAVLFDLGDTLIDFGIGRAEVEGIYRRGARITYDHLAAKGKNVGTFERYFRAHYRPMQHRYVLSKITGRDFSYAEVLRHVAKRLNLGITEHDLHELSWLWYRPILEDSFIDPGLRGMLDALRHSGVKMAIVSNTLVPPHCLDRHLDEAGLLEFFPVRVYSSHVRFRKPHPSIFKLALEQIGVAAEDAVFVGDLLHTDIAGAKKHGMRTIWKPAKKAPMTLSFRNRRHKPDPMLPRITQRLEALKHFGWQPHRIKIHKEHVA